MTKNRQGILLVEGGNNTFVVAQKASRTREDDDHYWRIQVLAGRSGDGGGYKLAFGDTRAIYDFATTA